MLELVETRLTTGLLLLVAAAVLDEAIAPINMAVAVAIQADWEDKLQVIPFLMAELERH
jgi:hypothetical protein